MIEGENNITMNVMILSKREETEKHISDEHSKLKANLGQLQLVVQEENVTNEKLQEEAATLNHHSAILSSNIFQFNCENKRIQKDLLVMECEIDELNVRQKQAQIVRDKENMTMNLLYIKIKDHQAKLDEFWKCENNQHRINTLNEKKYSLNLKKKLLHDNTEGMKGNSDDLRKMMPKLNEEIMILKKRNAAYLKRKSRRLEYLEQTLDERRKKTYLSR